MRKRIASATKILFISACTAVCGAPQDGRHTAQGIQLSWCASDTTSALMPIQVLGSSPIVDSLQTGEPAGLVIADSVVYALDAVEPIVRMFDLNLGYRGRFIHRGRGPGEMTPFRNRASAPVPDYLSASDTALLVLDPNAEQVLRFDSDGRFREVGLRGYGRHLWRPRAHNRMRWRADTLFFAGGAYYPLIPPGTRDHPQFQVRMSFDDQVRTLAMLPVHPVAHNALGAFMIGPGEAIPVWDMASECIIVNDGHSPVLHVWHRSSGTKDSLTFTLPRETGGYNFDAGSFGLPEFPEPALQKRVQNLVIGPDGTVWMQLPADSPRPTSVVVLRLHASGEQRLDTLPAFPQSFLPDGTWFGFGFDDFGTAVVRKGSS